MEKDNKLNIFISYSHEDKKWLKMMKRHFVFLKDKVEFWEDTKILPGQVWKDEILTNIEKCEVAILLISPDFFNSDFIMKNEVPLLLEAAEKNRVTILSIIVKRSLFHKYKELSKYQAINSPNMPLSSISKNKQEDVFINLVDNVDTFISKQNNSNKNK